MRSIRCGLAATCGAAVWLGALSVAAAGFGGTCARYDSSKGMLPSEQGWDMVGRGPSTAEVVGGVLHQSTMPFANPTCPGPPRQAQFLYWLASESFDFADGAAFEAEVQIVASEYGINPCDGWARPGFAMAMQDSTGRFFWIGIGENEVFLANNPYLDFGQPGLVEAGYSTAGGYHLFRLEANASGATLRIDGREILSIGNGARIAGGPSAYIGDGTSWTNSEALIKGFALESGSCCTGDLNGDGAVDGADLGLLLGGWGSGGTGDLNGDGNVDGADLGLLLGAWGACPR